MKINTIFCRDCGKPIQVPSGSHRILCSDCKVKSQKNHFKIFVEQKVLCCHPDCSNIVKIVQKKGSAAKEYIKGPWACTFHQQQPFELMKQDLICPNCHKVFKSQMINKTHQAKSQKISHILCPECHKQVLKENAVKASERLKENNPMQNVLSKEKMKKTLQEHIQDGTVQYKKGVDHHLFKGNRKFNLEVRSKLYPIWIYPILQRDQFKCTQCGSTMNLQVHHIRPLREICEVTFDKLNLPYTSSLITREKLGTEQYERALEAVLQAHSLEDGITLCKDCHKKMDYYYRPEKGEHKK